MVQEGLSRAHRFCIFRHNFQRSSPATTRGQQQCHRRNNRVNDRIWYTRNSPKRRQKIKEKPDRKPAGLSPVSNLL